MSFNSLTNYLLGGTIGNVGMLNAGTVSMLNAGTITTLGTMGTLGLLINGTLASSGTTTGVGTVSNIGTLNIGTVQISQTPTIKTTAYGTLGTAGAGTTFGTIQGTVGSGTEIIITGWSVVAISGTPTVSLAFGTAALPIQGTGVLMGGAFPAGGGIAQEVDNAINSGTNGLLIYGITSGTAFFTANYQTVATTV